MVAVHCFRRAEYAAVYGKALVWLGEERKAYQASFREIQRFPRAAQGVFNYQ